MMESLKEKYRIKKVVIHTLQIALAIFCVGIILALIPDVHTSEDSLIITFIGILATFVVIGNYSQVSHIIDENKSYQDKTEQRIEALNDTHEEFVKDVTTKVSYLRIKVEHVETLAKKIENLDFSNVEKQMVLNYQKNIEEINRNEYINMIDALIYLVQGEQRVLISNIIGKAEDKKYSVKRREENVLIKNVTASWENEEVVFRDENNEIIENVEKVSNKVYNPEHVNRILRILLKYQNTNERKTDTQSDVTSIIYE